MGRWEQMTRRNEEERGTLSGFETAEELGRCGEQRTSWQDPDVLGCDWRDGMPGLGRVCECVQVCV